MWFRDTFGCRSNSVSAYTPTLQTANTIASTLRIENFVIVITLSPSGNFLIVFYAT